MYALAEPRPLEAVQVPRDDHWLASELNRIWERFFSDVPRVNTVQVSFGRHWTTRLGLITLSRENQNTYIGINGLLRHDEVPDFVHRATLAHELAHYAHGFGSPLPQRFSHPHKGGVVTKELMSRGLLHEHRACRHWVHEQWRDFCHKKLVRL